MFKISIMNNSIRKPFFKYPEIESQLFKRNEPDKINNLLVWLYLTPKTTSYRVNLLKSNTESFKMKIEQEYFIKYKKPCEIFTIPEIPEVICIDDHKNNILLPDIGLKEIIVDSNCGAAILRGAHIFAPGVIGMQSGTQKEEQVNVFIDNLGKCKKGTNIRYDSEFKIFIGTGIVKMQRYELFGDKINPKGIAVEMLHAISGVPSLGDLTSKEGLLQNFPSIICSRILDCRPGETVLDMCSAPGNKTTHLAELMNDIGIIIALDKTESKIELVRKKLKLFEVNCVHCFAFDSTKSLKPEQNQSDVRKGPPFASKSFDRILLDAPCSALGNRPLIRADLNPTMLKSFIPIQRKLLKAAVGLLKSGGTLVYSTCTITEAENEGMVKWAKETFPELELVKSTPIFGGPGLENSGLSEEERHLVQRFGPNINNTVDSVGFFIAKFQKK